MKSAENLVDGSIAKTLGELAYTDGKGAFYKVREIQNTDVVDDENIIGYLVKRCIADDRAGTVCRRKGQRQEALVIKLFLLDPIVKTAEQPSEKGKNQKYPENINTAHFPYFSPSFHSSLTAVTFAARLWISDGIMILVALPSAALMNASSDLSWMILSVGAASLSIFSASAFAF